MALVYKRAVKFEQRVPVVRGPGNLAHITLSNLILIVSDAHPLLVVILLEVSLERLGNVQLRDAVVVDLGADDGARQVLQRERVVARQRYRQHRLKEHAASRVLVVLDQTAHSVRRVNAWVVRVKAESVVPLLYASM